MTSPPPLRQDGPDVLLEVQVQPRASRDQLRWHPSDCLIVRLTAPPVDGAANLACRTLLARRLGLPRSRVLLERGETARRKRLRLQGVTVAAVTARLQGS